MGNFTQSQRSKDPLSLLLLLLKYPIVVLLSNAGCYRYRLPVLAVV